MRICGGFPGDVHHPPIDSLPCGIASPSRHQRCYSWSCSDFFGISANSFDGRGNYTLGLREQLVFTEINYDQIDKVRGMEVSIVTTAQTDEAGGELLRMLGMPFRKEAY